MICLVEQGRADRAITLFDADFLLKVFCAIVNHSGQGALQAVQ